MSTRELTGRVTNNLGVAQAGTEIWLSAPGLATEKATTDQGGCFLLSLGDEFKAGSYRLEALPTPEALGANSRVRLNESGPPAPVELTVDNRDAVSARAGWAFMLSTIAVLALTTGFYLDLHDFSLEHIGQNDTSSEVPFFWSKNPEILLECLYWAFAATLIRLIFRSGWYLRKSRFLATAIPHHLAVAVAVPILAVLIGFFLSLVKVSLSLSEVELALDMSNVYIVILVAALIGFSPWKAWDFIQQLADLLFKKLGGLFKSDEPATD